MLLAALTHAARKGTGPVSAKTRFVLVALGWVLLVTGLHLWLNTKAFDAHAWGKAHAEEPFRVGFLPVTCHLTCPVTHYINELADGDGEFEPLRFSGWPELKEAFLADHLQAAFLLAPLAMVLREQDVPLKIIYLGHRDGTTMMVRKDSAIHRIEDLRGKTIAVPNRFSNQSLIVYKTLKERGMKISDVKLFEMAPPDMAAALHVRAVDAIIAGEPFMAQTELDDYGRVLFMTKDVWPEFISCVLVVSEKTIRTRRPEVQRLVDGIAKSGKWLDQNLDNRAQAADFVAEQYYNQDPRLLRFVLSKPPDRVKYTNLKLVRRDFEEIQALAVEAGLMQGTVGFDDYTDCSFVPEEAAIQPHVLRAD